MEGGTEAEKNKPPEGGETKSKRQMKTAAQLEVLEKTYAVESYPSEATRAELSTKLGLSDRQLQMWFCHRRLKDRKPTQSKRHRKESPAVDSKATVNANELVGGDAANERASFGHEVDPRRAVPRPGVALPRVGGDIMATRRYNEASPQLAAELRAIAFVEAQLGERLREDGPILGMEFDPLPPGAFGTPIETPMHHKKSAQAFETNSYERSNAKLIKDPVRTIREYQFLPEQPSARSDHHERVSPSDRCGMPLDASVMRSSSVSAGHSFSHHEENVPYGYGHSAQIPNLNLSTHQGRPGHVLASTPGEYELAHRKNYMDTAAHGSFDTHPIHAVDNPFVLSERKVGNDEDVLRMERKRKSEEARIAREVEAHEKRIRKELEKQDMLRRKREEQMRKEMERQDRERRKEEERLLRERQREEERYLKEQRREMLRREKFLLKESIRAEKMRQKEELRREKEAAKLRAANERAIARKIAKESMELIEDERLELMEMAASSKGLPSMVSLDFETLQNLDVYRDKLTMFPPKSVKLKKPFATKPWNGSEENVGNLFMVWRFLITFADVLGIWPFTLDEFAQAFHDYDPRLLGEVHIVLLRTIIKDIEDVARTPSVGVGANQNAGSNPGGGHPHIVEGAYAWGFDIRIWKRHLNALTWPEILRQFALSAGFGPQLKKCDIEQPCAHDENEINNSENVIFSLRNGVAAENAFAKMQERGLSNPRRSRHRLTPGTVKFAAFHVLSLEGEKGLTILEVAEKIQESGLRDLTTSKTPEASIAAALSRDTKLFERVAPSTYCVRAPYRKDVADAEAVLSEARERIRIFKSGVTDVEDVDDAERDEDSESDVGDDPEVDDLAADLNPKKEIPDAQETENSINLKPLSENGLLNAEVIKTESGLSSTQSQNMKLGKKDGSLADQSIDATGANDDNACLEQEDPCFDESKPGEPWVQGLIEGEYSDLSVEERLSALVALIGVAIEGNSIRVVLEERLEAVSALKKQMWAEVQLDKRRIKEEFVMRVNYSSYPGNKPEPNIMTPASDERKSPLAIGERTNEMPTDPAPSQERLSFAQNDQNYGNNVYSGGNMQMQDTAFGQENFQYQQQGYVADRERFRAQLKAYVGCKAEELYVYRSLPLGQDRRRNRYWRFAASASRSDPGCGRIFVELRDGRWRLIDSEEGFNSLIKSLDVRGVRESHLHFMLQKIEAYFKEAVRRNAFCITMHGTHDDRFKSEATEVNPSSCSNISSPRSSICGLDSDTADISTTFKIEVGSNITERCGALKRYQDFEKWMWERMFCSAMLSAFKYAEKKSETLFCICNFCGEVYFFEDIYCPSCHQMGGSNMSKLHFSEQVAHLEDSLKGDPSYVMLGSVSSPLRIRLLKIQLALVEASLPSEGFQPIWTENLRKSWGLKLLSSTTAEELLQVLAVLENALKRDYLSLNFETATELLGSSKEFEALAVDPSALSGSVPVLPWIPKTTAAVALRLFELDNSIAYMPNQRADPQKEKESGDFLVLENNALRNTQGNEATETLPRAVYTQEENWAELGFGCSSSGRGRPRGRGRGRPRARGRKSERRMPTTGSRSASGRRATANSNGEGLEQELRSKAQPRVPAGRKRGRRSTRSRKRPTKGALRISNGGCGGGREDRKAGLSGKPVAPRDIDDDWNETETPELRADGAEEEASSSGRSFQYNYDEGQAIGDEFDYEFDGGDPNKLLGGGDFNLHSDEEYEDDDYGNECEGDAEGNMDVEDYINEESDGEEQPGNGYDEQNDNTALRTFPYEDPDLTSSSSSGFSD